MCWIVLGSGDLTETQSTDLTCDLKSTCPDRLPLHLSLSDIWGVKCVWVGERWGGYAGAEGTSTGPRAVTVLDFHSRIFQ